MYLLKKTVFNHLVDTCMAQGWHGSPKFSGLTAVFLKPFETLLTNETQELGLRNWNGLIYERNLPKVPLQKVKKDSCQT